MKPANNKTLKLFNKVAALNRLGFSNGEALDLFKIERTLHRWHERECNGEIDRDETTGKVYGVFECHRRGPTRTRLPIRDLETAAFRKLDLIMTSKPALLSYVQTDPRGVALYILEKSALPPYRCKTDINYSNGLAVYNR
jgi:hypothetical protein